MSRRAILSLLAGLALALGAAVVAGAKHSPEHSPVLAKQLASARLATIAATNHGARAALARGAVPLERRKATAGTGRMAPHALP